MNTQETRDAILSDSVKAALDSVTNRLVKMESLYQEACDGLNTSERVVDQQHWRKQLVGFSKEIDRLTKVRDDLLKRKPKGKSVADLFLKKNATNKRKTA